MGTESIVERIEWVDQKRPGVKKRPTPDNFYPQKFDQGLLNQKPISAPENLDEALKKSPRLCWVWNADRWMAYAVVVGRVQRVHNWKRYIDVEGRDWEHAELISREEIEKYLGDS